MPYRGEHSGSLSVTMKIASSDVGKVIGRGGKKIREFEQAGGGRIKISNAVDEDDMKSIEISGNDQDIETTRQMIEDYLRDFSIDDSSGKHGGFSGDRSHSKPSYNSRGEGYKGENQHKDSESNWRRNEDDDRDFSVGDRGRKRGGFSGSHNYSKPVYSSGGEGYNKELPRHQDNGDSWGRCEDDDKVVSGGSNVGKSRGFGSSHGEEVYKSRNVYNSAHRNQDLDDKWGWHEEEEQADITSSSTGGGRGGFGGGRVYGSRGEGPSNRQHRNQGKPRDGDRRGRQEDYEKGSHGSGGDRLAVDDSETIYVMSSEVGKMIGRGGNTIRQLEADSGCRIKVSRTCGSSDQSPIELIGSKSAVADAKRLIQETGVEIVNESSPGH
ncbi:unnamed protein product, partial [Candidula unifasciata]